MHHEPQWWTRGDISILVGSQVDCSPTPLWGGGDPSQPIVAGPKGSNAAERNQSWKPGNSGGIHNLYHPGNIWKHFLSFWGGFNILINEMRRIYWGLEGLKDAKQPDTQRHHSWLSKSLGSFSLLGRFKAHRLWPMTMIPYRTVIGWRWRCATPLSSSANWVFETARLHFKHLETQLKKGPSRESGTFQPGFLNYLLSLEWFHLALPTRSVAPRGRIIGQYPVVI